MQDIRISTGFPDHPKTKKLIRKAGYEAVFCLLRLWIWAAQNRCKGVLDRMDEEDLEIVSGWSGEAGFFLSVCEDIGWLDKEDGLYKLHDWQEWQPWVYGAEDRGDKARFSRMAKTHPQIYAALKVQGIDAISSQKYVSLTSAQRNVNAALTPSPSPSPAPTPAPTPNDSPHKKSGRKVLFAEDSIEFRLSQLLFRCIRKNNPDYKKPNLQDWAIHVDRMLRIDKRNPEEAEQLIRWAQSDNTPNQNGFCWAIIILSTKNLRKQYDRLIIQMNSEQGDSSMSLLPPEMRRQ